MTIKSVITLASATLLSGLFTASTAAVEITPLLKTQTSWDGSHFHYPKGQAEITAIKVVLKQGEALPFHCHPVPTFGYILKGQIQVDKPDGSSTVFSAGDAVAEVMTLQHTGRASKGSVELVAFYAGAKGQSNTLKAGEAGCEK